MLLLPPAFTGDPPSSSSGGRGGGIAYTSGTSTSASTSHHAADRQALVSAIPGSTPIGTHQAPTIITTVHTATSPPPQVTHQATANANITITATVTTTANPAALMAERKAADIRDAAATTVPDAERAIMERCVEVATSVFVCTAEGCCAQSGVH